MLAGHNLFSPESFMFWYWGPFICILVFSRYRGVCRWWRGEWIGAEVCCCLWSGLVSAFPPHASALEPDLQWIQAPKNSRSRHPEIQILLQVNSIRHSILQFRFMNNITCLTIGTISLFVLGKSDKESNRLNTKIRQVVLYYFQERLVTPVTTHVTWDHRSPFY